MKYVLILRHLLSLSPRFIWQHFQNKMSYDGGGNHVLGKETEYEQFLQVHQPQLQSSGVPEWLWETLFHKLKNEVGANCY